MCGWCADEPDRPINARASVPTGVVLTGMIDTHGYDVVLTNTEVRCEVVEEGSEAAGTVTEEVAIDIDRGTVVYTLKEDVKTTTIGQLISVDGQMLAIPANASRQIALAGTTVGRHGKANTPVVGDSDALPAVVNEIEGDSCRIVGQIKEPTIVQ